MNFAEHSDPKISGGGRDTVVNGESAWVEEVNVSICVKWKPLELKTQQNHAGYKHVDSKENSREQKAAKKKEKKKVGG